MWENFRTSLLIMGQGMLGIFVAILVIVVAVVIMSKISKAFSGRKGGEE